MEIFFRKIIGWVLVVTGIIIIFWAIISAFSAFTARKEIPNVFVFSAEQKKTDCPEMPVGQGTQEEIKDQVEKMLQGQLKEQIQEILPQDFITKILNLAVYGTLMAFLIFAGGKISGIGTKLLRDKE